MVRLVGLADDAVYAPEPVDKEMIGVFPAHVIQQRFPDPPEISMAQRFTSRYRGKRYSFGYPACPNLEDQAGLWKLLRPEEIGVQLTEAFMMDPEASVSALVFHHPDCTYFSVGDIET